MITVKSDGKLFLLDTARTTYAFRVMETGHLEHLYYGRKIHLDSDDGLLEQSEFAPGNTNIYNAGDGKFSMEDIRLEISTIGASCLVLGMTSAAYQSQIFRGAIQSIPTGQLKAGRALGMKDSQSIVHVILPQALRLSIPGWSNEYSILLKDSAMCFALGTPEIMARTHFVASRTYEHLPLYITAGVIYFAITLAGVSMLRNLEKKVRIPGYNNAGM